MIPNSRKVIYEGFRYCCMGADPFVFVFDRPRYIPLTGKALEEYRANKSIVERHGGRMLSDEWSAGGENPKFSKKDTEEMIEAVLAQHPDLNLNSTWNGEGFYTFSVGCGLKPQVKKSRKRSGKS